MTKVVILGGGFAGVSAAKTLLEKSRRSEVQITLVDKNSYHLFTPSLYEVASSEEPQKNICIPLHEILKGVEIVKDEVVKIDKESKVIEFKNQTLSYDYLIVSLGSEPEYREIPGLKEHSIPFKTLNDAVRIRNLIREKLKTKEQVQVLVGGGGASGCEFSAELVNHLGNKVKVTLIQKSPQLVKELNIEAAKVAFKRLIDNNVDIDFGERITKVHDGFIETDRNDEHKFDVLVWVGGVKPSSVVGKSEVNEYLQVKGSENIFAAGDAAFLDEKIPQTVRVAKEEGEIASRNIVHKLNNEHLEKYEFKNQIFIVPLVGKYAVVQFNNILIKGLFGWVIQQFVFLRYLLSILPINKAIKRWNRFEEYLMRD